MSTGPWKIEPLDLGREEAGQGGRADDARRRPPTATSRTSRQPGWPVATRTAWTGLSHGPPPPGCRSGRRGPCRRGPRHGGSAGRSWVGGRSRSGRPGRPGRTARRWTGRRPTACPRPRPGCPGSRILTMSSTAERIGSRSAPRTPVPSRASTMTAAFSSPGRRPARRARPAGGPWRCRRRRRCGPSSSPRRRSAAAPRWRTTPTTTSAAVEGQPAGGDEAVAAVVARAAQDDDRPGPPALGVDGQGLDRGGDRRPGVLHQPLLGDAQHLRPAVGAGHRLGPDRRQRRAVRPARAQAAQVAVEERRIVGRQGARRGGSARGHGGRRHGLARVPGPCLPAGRRQPWASRALGGGPAVGSSSMTPSRASACGGGRDALRAGARRSDRPGGPTPVRGRAQAVEDAAAQPAVGGRERGGRPLRGPCAAGVVAATTPRAAAHAPRAGRARLAARRPRLAHRRPEVHQRVGPAARVGRRDGRRRRGPAGRAAVRASAAPARIRPRTRRTLTSTAPTGTP